ncbi:MAG TPA: hypothetical protein VHY08_19425 [Bacillota bacterium]|nr:hypothetical protein [Bacillota bacterium]
MPQPTAIYASIPSTDPSAPNWLSTPPNLLPVSVADPFPDWPNLDWRIGGITPLLFSEITDYLWQPAIADPTDGTEKQFTRRLTVGSLGFTSTHIQHALYSMILTIAADDQYQVLMLVNGSPVVFDAPNPGFNFAVPNPLTWRNVKTFAHNPVNLFTNDTVDIQVNARNVPQPPGTPPANNPAMFTWILQLFQLGG